MKMKSLHNIQLISSGIKMIFGFLCVLCYACFILISLPVYAFRLCVKCLATLLRPDLAEIMDGQSATLVTDYFLETTPRSNLVVASVIQGKVTFSEVREHILKVYESSANTPNNFEKFFRYPVCWLGFPFWKKARNTFNVDNHLSTHSSNTAVLEDVIEKLLNDTWPKKQSPWHIHLIENYYDPNSPNSEQSVLLCKWHHSLTDGMGSIVTILQTLDPNFKMEDMGLRQNISEPEKKTKWQSLWNVLTCPFVAIKELSIVASHVLTPSHFRVPDNKKKWHQIVTVSQPISVQEIKNIKNLHGVSFTSVLLYSLSCVANKILHKDNSKLIEDTVQCFSVLPLPKRPSGLNNAVTAAALGLPVKDFGNSLEHLKQVHKTLQNKRNTVFPLMFYYFTVLAGCHFQFVCRALSTNQMFPVALTNFAGVQKELSHGNRKVLGLQGACGALQGDLGFGFTVISHHNEVRIQLITEQALLSKDEAKQLVNYAREMILNLKDNNNS